MKTKFHYRSATAMSIVELLVSVAILGVAIAGLTDLLWINGLFAIRQFNKVDNIAGADHFLDQLGTDVRSAAGVNAPTVTSFTLVIPFSPAKQRYMPAGSYLAAPQIPAVNTSGRPEFDSITYEVTTDPNQTESWCVQRTFTPDSASGRNSVGPTTVLRGVIGPMNAGAPHIFDYGANGTIPTSTYNENAFTSVIVNLDLKCINSSNPKTSSESQSNLSFGLRRQFTMRNRAGLWYY